MARPIITKEDVKGAKGTLEVAPDAVVTQAARELAARTGVTIQHSGESAPAPLPARLPEAAAAPLVENKALVTCVGRNRPYILAEITQRLAELGGSVHDISQRIVGDYFSTIFVVDLTGVDSFGTFKADMEGLSREGDYKVVVQHERIFKAMHRL